MFVRLFCLALLLPWLALSPRAGCQTDYAVEYLGLVEGLPAQRIHAVTQDQQGLMWFAAYGVGLIRYDGEQYQIIRPDPSSKPSLSSFDFVDMVADCKGRLWIAYRNGLDVFDPTRREILKVALPRSDSSSYARISSLYADPGGDIWMTTYTEGLFCFPQADPLRPNLVSAEPNLFYINRGTDGRIWCLQQPGRAMVIANGQLQVAEQSAEIMSGFVSIENQEGIFAGGLRYLPLDRVLQYRLNRQTGRLEPGTSQDGLVPLSLEDFTRKLPYERQHMLDFSNPFGDQFRVYKDSRGISWVPTRNFGLFKLRPREIRFTTCPELRKASLRGMIEAPDGSIYIFSYSGIYRYFPRENRAVLINRAHKAFYDPLFFHAGRLLAMTDGGGFRLFDPQTGKESKFNPAPGYTDDESYFACLPDDGEGWMLAGNRRLFRIRRSDLAFQPLAALPVSDPFVRCYAFERTRDGNTWIGTTRGVFVLSPAGTCDTPSVRRDYRLGATSQINDIYEDRHGNLWFATRTYGLLRYTPATQNLTVFDDKRGFASNETYAIAGSYDDKVLWISTAAGIHALHLDNLHLSVFGESDGASCDEFNTGSFLRTRAGEVYFGSVKGLTRFHPDSLHVVSTLLPPARIFLHTVILTDHRRGETRYLNYPNCDTSLILSHGMNTIEFQFGSDDYFRPGARAFSCWLAGFDHDWVPLGNRQSVRYYNLPAGKYRLIIRSGPNGDDNSALCPILFEIETVWYRRWPFLVVVLLLAFSLAWLLFRFRLNQLRREERLRHRIASDLHDELGANLSNISFRAQLAEQALQDGKPAETHMHKLIEHIRAAHSAMSDVIWTIDPVRNDSRLARRMRDYADEWLVAAGIPVHFESNATDSRRQLSLETKHQLLLLYKELLSNILKHTEPESVRIRFDIAKDKKVFLLIENTFRKTRPDSPSSGRGLPGVRERVERLGGTVEITQRPGYFSVLVQAKTS